jgi:hypothetical protein
MNAISLAVALAALIETGHDPFVAARELPIGPTSRVWVTGASNIRRFTCRAGELDGALHLRGIATRGPRLSGLNTTAAPSLSVVVARLECGNGAMSKHLRETLRAPEHPVITFRLTSYDVDLTGVTPDTRIVGEVTVAGITRTAVVNAAVVPDSLGHLRVRGSYVMRMSDFGLEPPRRFGGLLRVRDRVVVHFDVLPGDHDGDDDVFAALTIATEQANSNSGAYHVARD